MNTGAFRFFGVNILVYGAIIFGTHAQSVTVRFSQAGLPTPPDRLVRDVNGTPLAGTNYVAQLYVGGGMPDSFLPITAEPARFRSPNTTMPGTWQDGGPRQITPPQPEPIVLQVRVWDLLAGSTYEEASQSTTGAQYGKSEAFIFEPCPSPPRSGCDWMYNFRGFTLVTNPPPNTLVIRDHREGGIELLYAGRHTIEQATSLRGPWLGYTTDSAPVVDRNAETDLVRFYRINDGTNYSVNAVGFYRLLLCNGFSLIANQLNAAGGNRISNLFASPPESTRIYKYNPATGGFVFAQFVDGQWEGADAAIALNPGEGMFLWSTLTSHRFLGDVPTGNRSVQVPQGFSLLSNPLPEAGPVNLLPPGGIGLPVREGSAVFQWNCGQGNPGHYIFNQYIDGAWEGSAGGGIPTVSIGEAFFFFNPGPSFGWNRNFSVGE